MKLKYPRSEAEYQALVSKADDLAGQARCPVLVSERFDSGALVRRYTDVRGSRRIINVTSPCDGLKPPRVVANF